MHEHHTAHSELSSPNSSSPYTSADPLVGAEPHHPTDRQLLERAMREAVDFIHAEGWDQPPTMFGLVPTSVIARETGAAIDDADQDNLTLVVQDLPDMGSGDELQDYVARTAWPPTVTGAIVAQEIMFQNSAEPGTPPRKARLFSGIIDGGPDLTLLQLRPTEDELKAAGAFGHDNIDLLGGPDVAPGIVALLRSTFDAGHNAEATSYEDDPTTKGWG